MESMALMQQDYLSVHEKNMKSSVQCATVASVHFKCAYLETFQTESFSSDLIGKFLVPSVFINCSLILLFSPQIFGQLCILCMLFLHIL